MMCMLIGRVGIRMMVIMVLRSDYDSNGSDSGGGESMCVCVSERTHISENESVSNSA